MLEISIRKLMLVSLTLFIMASSLVAARESNMDISSLINKLVSTNDEIRINAENELISLGEDALPSLEKVLFSSNEDMQVLQGVIARLLGKIGGGEAVDTLLQILPLNPHEFVQIGALSSIEKIGIVNSQVIKTVRGALFAKSNEVRVAAANTLASFGTEAKDVGIDLLLLSASGDVRFAWACQTAARKVYPGILPLQEQVVDEVVSRLTSLEWQDLAVRILANNASQTFQVVKNIMLNSNEQVILRNSAFKVIQQIGINDEEIVTALLNIVNDESEPSLIRLNALTLLKDVKIKLDSITTDKIEQALTMDLSLNYINDDQIAIQVENFSTTDRENVAIHALVGFPKEYAISADTNLAVRDNETLIYSEITPITYWDPEQRIIRSAELTFYPNLQALEPKMYFLDLISKDVSIEKPKTVDTTGQVRVSTLEKGLEFIVTSKLDLKERWLTQLVVAKNGAGNYSRVQSAIDSIPSNNTERIVVYIKEGTYHEKILLTKDKSKVTFIGENKETTILDYNETPYVQYSSNEIYNNWGSASTIILSGDFTAENITFSNSAPVGTGQALAIRLEGDRMSFVNNKFLSTQDTIFANGEGRQYFYNCYIEGDVDFIFGSATAVFENCDIVNVRKTGGYITAASTPKEQEFGFVFINSRIIGDVNPGSVWLGRPWRPYSHTAYINCYMSEVVQPTGWHNWGKTSNEATARYIEYKSYGPGANPHGRVSWSSQLTKKEASKYTVENILYGHDNWNPGINQ